MVYKHRMKNGKIRHYQSKAHFQRSIKGFFANQDRDKSGAKKKAKKAQAKSTKSKRVSTKKPSVSGKRLTKAEKLESEKQMRILMSGRDLEPLPTDTSPSIVKSPYEPDLTEASKKLKEEQDRFKSSRTKDYLEGKIKNAKTQDDLEKIEDLRKLGMKSGELGSGHATDVAMNIQRRKGEIVLEMQQKHHTKVPLDDLKKAQNMVDVFNITEDARKSFDDGFIGKTDYDIIKEASEKRQNELVSESKQAVIERAKKQSEKEKELIERSKRRSAESESSSKQLNKEKAESVSQLMNNIKDGKLIGNNDWEKRFLKSVSDRYFKNGSLSPRQLAVLRRIESGVKHTPRETTRKPREKKKKLPPSRQGFRYFASSNKGNKPREIFQSDANEILEGKQIKDSRANSFWSVVWKVPRKLNKPTSLNAIGYSGVGGFITKIAGFSPPQKEVKVMWKAKKSTYKFPLTPQRNE